MNPKGSDCPGQVRLSTKRFLLAAFPAMLCVLVTGCPHNDYTVELKPKGAVIERRLTFYRTEESHTNSPYFSSNQLAAITRIYPIGAVKPDGKKFVAEGEFAGALPNDVGGAGAYTNFTTSLGGAGFYTERFRGDDDLAAKTARQFRAADQLTDLVIGWSKTEFGRERDYKKLRKFLDEDFRRDLKNAAQYFQLGNVVSLSDTNAPDEFTARFCQYLYERGYLKLSDAPEIYLILNASGDDSSARILRLVQRLAAEKMGIAATNPLPKSLSILGNPDAFEKSWERYLSRTDLYRAKVREWELKKKTNPKLAEPKPLDAPDDLMTDLLGGFGGGGESDHLTVKLALAHAPNQTNGKWQDGQIVWTADLEADRPLPEFCYARWSNPDAQFQSAHFGTVILDGDELSDYCLWQNGLEEKQARDWETFLAGLQPSAELRNKIEIFQFTAGMVDKTAGTNQLNLGRKLLLDALGTNTVSK